MRIKKKNVLKESYLINEAILLDQLSHIKPNVKKVLKLMYKKFVKKDEDEEYFQWWRLSHYDIQEFLTKDMGVPDLDAYKITKFFIKYGEKLFADQESFIYEPPLKEIIKEMFSVYLGRFIKEKWNYPDLLFTTKINDEEYSWDDYEIWDTYKGFSIYLSYVTEIDTSILISFYFGYENEDENTFLIEESKVRIESAEGTERIDILPKNTKIDLPKDETYESFVTWMQELISNTQIIFRKSNYNIIVD